MKKLLLVASFVSFACYAENNAQNDAVKTPEELCAIFAQYPRRAQYEIMDKVYRLCLHMELIDKHGKKQQEIMRKVFLNRAHKQDDHMGLTEEEISWLYLINGSSEHYLELAFMKQGVYTGLESTKFGTEFEKTISIGMEDLSEEELKKMELLDQISTSGVPAPEVSDQEVDEALSILFRQGGAIVRAKDRARECHACFAKVLNKQQKEKE
jgi:hypothetical protein